MGGRIRFLTSLSRPPFRLFPTSAPVSWCCGQGVGKGSSFFQSLSSSWIPIPVFTLGGLGHWDWGNPSGSTFWVLPRPNSISFVHSDLRAFLCVVERSSEVLIWQEKRRNNWSHADIVLYSCHQAYSNFTPIGLGWSPDTWLSSAEINKCLYRDKRNHSKGFETPLGSQKGSYVMLRNLFLLLLNKFELSSPNHVGTILQVCRDWIRANFPAPHCRWCNCIAIFNLFLISPSSRRAVSKFLLPLGDSHREIRCYQCFVGSCGLNRDFCVVYLLPCN